MINRCFGVSPSRRNSATWAYWRYVTRPMHRNGTASIRFHQTHHAHPSGVVRRHTYRNAKASLRL
jgi:hypothetical protein